jgi:hypothetical protein
MLYLSSTPSYIDLGYIYRSRNYSTPSDKGCTSEYSLKAVYAGKGSRLPSLESD